MTPWLDDGDVRLYHGDALVVLAGLDAGSVQTVVTSPPYWSLRDYGTGAWSGGDADCDHDRDPHRHGRGGSGAPGKQTAGAFPSDTAAAVCRCGARRIDSQLGLEATPDAYVAALVAVFREVWRVLRDDGTLWLNLGDSYSGGGGFWPTAPSNTPDAMRERGERNHGGGFSKTIGEASPYKGRAPAPGLKPKDLVGIPWRVAFALQADGWYLRSDIVWSKPNPMPESVTDRPTKAHEYVFLLSKRARYYWDADAVREPHISDGRGGFSNKETLKSVRYEQAHAPSLVDAEVNPLGRNARSVWEIATQPTPEAHFATYPEALVRRCILAGSSEAGGCGVCGAPWVRQVETTGEWRAQHDRQAKHNGEVYRTNPGGGIAGANVDRRRIDHGWAPSCACGAPAVPQTVLDPFVGSGTTALVARKHGRRAIGIDLSSDYLGIAARRLGQQSLFAAPLPARVAGRGDAE